MDSLGENTETDEPQQPGGKPDGRRKAMAAVVPLLIPLLGLAAVIAGVVTAWAGRNQPFDFGFVSPPDLFSPSGVAFLGPLTQAGYMIALLGLLILAVWAGLRRGAKARTTVLMLLLGLAVVTGGMVTAQIGRSEQFSFGWFAYAPLSNETFSSESLLILGPLTQAGYVIAAVGLLVLAFWAGRRLRRPATA